jgi:hypothetical protein
MSNRVQDKLTITMLRHDLKEKKSWVTMVWDDPPARHIGLEVPYGTSLDDLHREAMKAVEKFSAEFAVTPVNLPRD